MTLSYKSTGFKTSSHKATLSGCVALKCIRPNLIHIASRNACANVLSPFYGYLGIHQADRRCNLVRSASDDKDISPDSSSNPPLKQAKSTSTELNVSAPLDMNQLQTLLASAIQAEDYQLAAKLRDEMKKVGAVQGGSLNWREYGLPEWLCDRAERLGFTFPTEVQMQSVRAIAEGRDVVVRGATGSGKTLAFLMPALARLHYPPDLFPEDLLGPQCVVLVPTMELGVQLCLLIYKLFGGNTRAREPGDRANIFTYMGPKGIKVRGLLNREEVVMALGTSYLAATHVVVATPSALAEVATASGNFPCLDDLQVLVVDEADEVFRREPEAMAAILNVALASAPDRRPQVVLVGATLDEPLLHLAQQKGWLKNPVDLGSKDAPQVPSGIKHRYIVCEPPAVPVTVLVRQLRADLTGSGGSARALLFVESQAAALELLEPLTTALWAQHNVGVLLASADGVSVSTAASEDPEGAQGARSELQGSAPFSATEPIRALHAFRDNKSSLLICTPAAGRGLDLPSVSHVYNMGVPPDVYQYLHRAGRTGRIGAVKGGIITTILKPEELERLVGIRDELGLNMVQLEVPQPVSLQEVDLEDQRRGLEDLFSLM